MYVCYTVQVRCVQPSQLLVARPISSKGLEDFYGEIALIGLSKNLSCHYISPVIPGSRNSISNWSSELE